MKQSDIIYTINEEYYIEIRERKCYNTFRLRLMNSNKERVDEICCPRTRYGLSMQRLMEIAHQDSQDSIDSMHYVMKNKYTEELIIISHKDYNKFDLFGADNSILFTHKIIYAASYEDCLEYCENIIGYKED